MAREYIHYHADGSVWGKGGLKNGEMHGKWLWFRKPLKGKKQGTKMRTGTFDQGKQVGKWTTYDRDGRVVKVTDFNKKKK